MNKRIKNINDVQKKWENLGITASSIDNTTDTFPTLLPIAMKIAAKTIGGASKEQKEEIENRIKSENRDAKIDAVVEGKPFIEKKLEDDPEYKEIIKDSLVEVKPMSKPSGMLFFMDMVYDDKNKKK